MAHSTAPRGKNHMILPNSTILEVYHAAIRARVDRNAALSGIDRSTVARIALAPSPGSQILTDLQHLNDMEATTREAPLVTWLETVIALVGPIRQRAIFEEALAAVRTSLADSTNPPSTPSASSPMATEPKSTHYLDQPTFPFHVPEADTLYKILYTTIWDPAEIRRLLAKANIDAGNMTIRGNPQLDWHSVLEKTALKGKSRLLVNTIANDSNYEGIHPILLEHLGNEPPAVRQAPPLKRKGNERRTGHDDTLLDIVFLEQGLIKARSVVHLEVYGSERIYGTGFVISPNHILTNHHVLFDNNKLATEVIAMFDYQMDANYQPRHTARISCSTDCTIRLSDPTHDWAVVELSEPTTASPLALDHKKTVRERNRVYIIQHPFGLPKKIALAHNEVCFVDDNVIRYLSDTEQGSSGSPVFNERWEVVALHHSWVQTGSDSKPGDILNEGIAIARVSEGLMKKGFAF
ncbi:MAG: trypsin-like peptidase domain-containing protein [Polyangiaceae bacterium]|nr:trypsin-like peptidase domain-containing protein [Polyangiaceae bacterium]